MEGHIGQLASFFKHALPQELGHEGNEIFLSNSEILLFNGNQVQL